MYSRYNQQQPGQKLVINPALISGNDPVTEIKDVIKITAASPGTQTTLTSGTNVSSVSSTLATESDTTMIVAKMNKVVPKSGTIYITLQGMALSYTLSVTHAGVTGWSPPSLVNDTILYPITADFDISTVTWSNVGSLTVGSSSGFSTVNQTPNIATTAWTSTTGSTASILTSGVGASNTPGVFRYTNPSAVNAINFYGFIIKVKPTAPTGLGAGATLVSVSFGLNWYYTNSVTSRFTKYRGWVVQ